MTPSQVEQVFASIVTALVARQGGKTRIKVSELEKTDGRQLKITPDDHGNLSIKIGPSPGHKARRGIPR